MMKTNTRSLSFLISGLFFSGFAWASPAPSQRFQQSPDADYTHHCPEQAADGKLVIHHIAVGQGDATFIRTPQGLTILVDAGLPSRGENEIVPLLKNCYGLDSIDYIFLTHFDQDHHGGMYEVIEAIPPRLAIYDPGEEMNAKNAGPGSAYKRYADSANATGKRRVPELGRASIQMPMGDPTVINVVAINGNVLGGERVDVLKADGKPKNDNAISIALTIRLGEFDYFIGGDLTGGGDSTPDVETPVARVVGDVDVLHANHHGSKTSNNAFFLRTLNPEHVVISVGDDGLNRARYRLPSAPVMELMDSFDFIQQIFQTSAGATQASADRLRKVSNENRDVVVLAEPAVYSINGINFPVDRAQQKQ
jgi:competence protein ComEC